VCDKLREEESRREGGIKTTKKKEKHRSRGTISKHRGGGWGRGDSSKLEQERDCVTVAGLGNQRKEKKKNTYYLLLSQHGENKGVEVKM